jgi:hypothetical protein
MEERRTAHRHKMSVAVVVRRRPNATASEFVHAKTRDVSTGGLIFHKQPTTRSWDASRSFSCSFSPRHRW